MLLAGVSFEIGDREKIAVVGPNGAGKTTLLRALLGLAPRCRGEVLLDGHPMDELSRRERARQVAMVSQLDAPDPRYLVRDYVALGRVPHAARADDGAAVERALAQCGAARFASRRLGTLSSGERQRVLLARALAQRPRLLLVDEPTSHLDLFARAEMLRVLRGLDVAVLAVLHDLPLVSGFADRVLLLHEGRRLAFGPPDEVLTAERTCCAFGLDCVPAVGPDGRSHLVFEARGRGAP